VTSPPEPRVDLVFEGGGVKGIALAGAFAEIARRGFEPQCVAGTSAGAITAALVAAGYTGEELVQLVTRDMHFQSFADRPRLHELGALGEAIEVAKHRGIHSGDYFLGWMRERLAAKGIHRFGDLRDPDASQENRSYRLQVIASDVSDHSMLVLPRDAHRLGIEADELGVAEAVRMSMSIPIFFVPVMHTNPHSGHVHMIVDGGLLSNFPVWLFDCPGEAPPRFPTFGVALIAPASVNPLGGVEPESQADAAVEPPSFVGYVKALAQTALEAHDRFFIEEQNFARTIPVPTLGVHTTDFGITPGRADALAAAGTQAAARFLDSWDFDAYIRRYRSPTLAPAS
jgi:NTE family protein